VIISPVVSRFSCQPKLLRSNFFLLKTKVSKPLFLPS
jgi:hypothetical protein